LDKDRTLVNTADSKGYTPLHLAAESGSFESAKILLDNYADPKLLTSFGATALHLACRGAHTDIVDLLMHKCKAEQFLNTEDEFGFMPMRYAVYTGSIPFIDALINYGGDLNYISKLDRRRATHDAAEMGKCELLQFLAVDRKMPLETLDAHGNTPMHVASFFGHVTVIRDLVSKYRVGTSALNGQGATAFFLACQQGHGEVVRYFLEVDSYLMRIPITENNRLPIHYAIYNGHEDVVAILLEYGADILSSNDARRKTVFDFAVQAGRSNIAEMLIKALKKK
jgi:ankyrin repeat protein